MKYIEILVHETSHDTVVKISQNVKAIDLRFFLADEDRMQLSRMVVPDYKVQEVMDSLSHIIGVQETAKIVVLDVKGYLPKDLHYYEKEVNKSTTAREVIYNEMDKSTNIGSDYIALVILSTIVATIGLITDNLAVIIGAMVIAPLLGPNIAFSFASVTGDTELLFSAFKTICIGFVLVIGLPMGVSYFFEVSLETFQIIDRTTIKLEFFLLALASGGAAAISVTTGLSSALVGVMVSVALLPPAVVLGLMLGAGNMELAHSTAIVLLVNVISITLASKVVFFMQGIRPVLWFEIKKARIFLVFYMFLWVTLLVLLFSHVSSNPELFSRA